jgi:hypothetical protein
MDFWVGEANREANRALKMTGMAERNGIDKRDVRWQ